MTNSEFKWLMAGLAGALFSLVAILVTTVLVAWYFPDFFVDGRSVGVRDREDEPEMAVRCAQLEAFHQERQRELNARIAELGLDVRYKSILLHDDTRVKLYDEQDFVTVESRLSAQLATCATPLEMHRYGQHINRLSVYTSDIHPLERLQVLNAWVAQRPESHHARLIRGGYGLQYAIMYSGHPMSEASKNAGWVEPREQLRQARADLLAAAQMNPKDPESFWWLMRIEGIKQGTPAQVESYFQQVIAAAPYHLDAHGYWISYGKPSRGGTWALVEKRAAETAAKSAGFPLLSTLKDLADDMRQFDMGHGKVLRSGISDEDLSATEALLEQYPDDIHLMADAAFYAANLDRMDRAAHWFTLLGEVYPDGSAFGDVVEFHEARLMALGEHGA